MTSFSKTLFAVALFLGVFAFGGTYAQSTWNYLGGRGFSGITGYYSSMVITGTTPYVVFEGGESRGPASVMMYNGSSWQNIGAPGFTGAANSNALFTTIAINKHGNVPYIAYVDETNSSKAMVMKYTGSAWDTVGTADFSAAHATFTSIAIDSGGIPYVAYIDGSNYFKATVKALIGNTWVNAGAAGGISSGEADFISITIDTTNVPYIVYQDADSNQRATVKKYTDGSWVRVGQQGFTPGRANYTSIAIDTTTNIPYIAYSDLAQGGKITVMRYVGSAWVNVGAPGFSDSLASYTTINIDKHGTPYVAYSDGGTPGVGGNPPSGGKATVMMFDGIQWQIVCSWKITDDVAWFTSIATDANGVPYVAFTDFGDTQRVSVMALNGTTGACTGTEVKNVITTKGLEVYPNPATAQLTIASSEAINTITISNIMGQTMTSPGLSKGEEVIRVDVSGWPSGVYFVKVNGSEVRKFVKE